jgi:hypothetical protein
MTDWDNEAISKLCLGSASINKIGLDLKLFSKIGENEINMRNPITKIKYLSYIYISPLSAYIMVPLLGPQHKHIPSVIRQTLEKCKTTEDVVVMFVTLTRAAWLGACNT